MIKPMESLILSAFIMAIFAGGRAVAVDLPTPMQTPEVIPTPIPAATPKPVFIYEPANEQFWDDVQSTLKDQNYEKIVRLAEERIEEVKPDTIDQYEAQLAEGIALEKLNMTYGATEIFAQLIKKQVGTSVSQQALLELDNMAQAGPVDEDLYNDILNDNEFDTAAFEQANFVNYFQGMFNLLHGFDKWSEKNFKAIEPGTYWSFKLQYYKALKEVADDKIDKAEVDFQKLADDPAIPDDLKTSSEHQYARLLFEHGDYEKAYQAFKKVKLNPREKGLILLERAWSKYYLKDYSKALGLLAALESPLFDSSRSPEPYILRMVMLKELCYYGAAFDVVKEFNKRFGHALKVIRRRGNLRNDPVIVTLALLDHRLEVWVDFLNRLRDEKNRLDDFGWKDYSFYPLVKKHYDAKTVEVKARLNYLLMDKVREVANDLLDWQEQMTFLEFQTRLDSLRVIKSSSDNETPYKPEDIPHMTFDKIFWETRGEYWLDELEDYKVFVKSQCRTEGGSDK